MDRIRKGLTRHWLRLAALAALAATGSAPTPAAAQMPGFGPTTVTLRVVDQNGTVLNGAVVQELGNDATWATPATVTVDGGMQVFLVTPAFQGAMFPGGFALPAATNNLTRTDIVMVDGSSPTLDFTWQTTQVAMSVVDQGGAAIAGARWGFDGDGAFYAPGTVTAPINDASVYPNLSGPATGGWRFAAQAAFAGAPVDLFRTDTRSITAATSALAFEWRQVSCNMGVVDGTGAALRGATWTMLGHTFAEGDAITLPVTDAALYPTLSGGLAAGIPTTLATNTPAGTGTATFSVLADGSLAPASVTIGGQPFALRCGVTAPPPITTGALAGVVTKDGAPLAGAALTVVDAASASHALTTDATGAFTLADVPQGAATVTLTIPAGTHGVDPASGQRAVTIVAEQTAAANFAIATDVVNPPPPPPVDDPMAWDYWWHEAKAAQKGKGAHLESFADMRMNFPQAIFDRFANAASDPVHVQGVTEMDDDGPAGPAPARRLSIDDIVATLDPSHPSPKDDAKSELLVVLLNVVSGRLSLDLVVDSQGTTLDREIRVLAGMINDGASARIARNRGQAINAGRAGRRHDPAFHPHGDDALDAGASADVTPMTTGLVPAAASLTATRLPDASVSFTMALPVDSDVSLDVYDVTGRHVAQLWHGTAPVGLTSVAWSHGGVRAGMYFARMVSPQGVAGAKVLVTP